MAEAISKDVPLLAAEDEARPIGVAVSPKAEEVVRGEEKEGELFIDGEAAALLGMLA